MVTVQEVRPRVLQFIVAGELGFINGSPTTYRCRFPDGTQEELESGQMAVRFQPGWKDHRLSEQLDDLRSLVPPALRDDVLLQHHLRQHAKLWGPNPDPITTESSGSSRVWSGCCPAGVLQVHDAATVSAGRRWVQDQALRGCQYAHWFRPQDREHYLGQGYTTSAQTPGGFSARFNRELPELDGVPYQPSGLQVPQTQHGTVDALVWFALRFNSYSAMTAAVGQWQAMLCEVHAGAYMPSRAWGWLLKATAYVYQLALNHPLCVVGVDDVLEQLALILRQLELRGYLGGVAPDDGDGGSEGGHLEGEVSDCSWFVGITLSGLLDCQDLGPQPPFQQPELPRLVDRCLGFLSNCWRPELGAFLDDRAVLTGSEAFDPKSVRAVQARFILPGLLRLQRGHMPELVEWTRPIIENADAAGWWGQSNDRQLWRAEVLAP